MTGWWGYDSTARTLLLTVHVHPNARSTEVVGTHADALKVRVAAPAVDHKANSALIRFIADALAVPSRAVALVRGAQGRRKVIAISEAGPEVVSKARALGKS